MTECSNKLDVHVIFNNGVPTGILSDSGNMRFSMHWLIRLRCGDISSATDMVSLSVFLL